MIREIHDAVELHRQADANLRVVRPRHVCFSLNRDRCADIPDVPLRAITVASQASQRGDGYGRLVSDNRSSDVRRGFAAKT